GLVHVQINFGVGLHALEDVQAAASAVALDLVPAVGDTLQLLEHKARHDQLGVDNPRITNIGNPAIDDDTRVQDQRPRPLNLFGKLDIRNNEAELLLGLHQHRHADVTEQQGHKQPRPLQNPRIDVLRDNRFQRHPEQAGQEGAHEQSEKDRRDGGDLFVLGDDVEKYDNAADAQSEQKAENAGGELVAVGVEVEQAGGDADEQGAEDAAQNQYQHMTR